LRTTFIAGNWKMNTTAAEAVELVRSLKDLVKDVTKVRMAVCPPFPYLSQVAEILKDSPIDLGAQNMFWENQGAFTGETSGKMLKDVGCKYVIVGHSERRHFFSETDSMVNRKAASALETGLNPILCIGETLEERESDRTLYVIRSQLQNGLENIDEDAIQEITFAYEPIWAIGTGKTATPEQAEDIHRFIREWLVEHYSKSSAENICIQYGGSVKPANAKELLSQPNIDGALVGGASLKAEDFAGIIKASLSKQGVME